MDKIKFFILLLIFAPWAVNATGIPEGKYKKTKVIRKTFQTGTNGNLVIDNIYGNIQVTSWSKNIVDIKVTINVDGDDADLTAERLERINVVINREGNTVKAKTMTGKWVESWSLLDVITGKYKQKRVNFKILYEIKIPKQFNLTIDNQYGNFYLDKLHGKLSLNMEYGKFDIGELLYSDNNINVEYITSSSIDFVKGAFIKADYSKINIDSAYKLDLNCDYTDITINNVRRLKFKNDYGSIKVKNGKVINGSGDYQTRHFSGIDYLDFSGDYGSLKIMDLLPEFQKINLQCDYTNVKITNSNQVPYQLELFQEYGNFKHNGLTIYKEIIDNGDKTIKAFYKNRNTSSVIRINMDYGNLKIINP
jgi:hypothetical protein